MESDEAKNAATQPDSIGMERQGGKSPDRSSGKHGGVKPRNINLNC